MVSTPSRFSDASQALPHVLRLAVDAQERAVRRRARCRTSSPARPRSRRSRIARPTSRSFVHGPYTSAVSRKVIPRSSARWMVAIDRRFVGGPVEIRHAHASEAEGGHTGAGSAELARWNLHDRSACMSRAEWRPACSRLRCSRSALAGRRFAHVIRGRAWCACRGTWMRRGDI